MRRPLITRILGCIVLCWSAALAWAQPYPSKPVKILVPFVAGGTSDIVARAVSQKLNEAGYTTVVENKPGANGSIAGEALAKSPNDGYTLLFTHIAQATLHSFFRKLPYDIEKDFEYLGMVSENPMNLIARPTLAANHFSELVQWLQANNGKVTIGNAGPGSASHLCGMMLQSALKINLIPVPYKGTAPAMTDLMGGQIDLMCDQTTTTIAQVEAKKVKSYAVTTPARLSHPALKDMPTLQELGLKDFYVSIWQGLYAPAGTPAAVLARLNQALKAAVKDPEFIRRQENGGATVFTDTRVEPSAHKAFVRAEAAKWAPIIKASGVYAD